MCSNSSKRKRNLNRKLQRNKNLDQKDVKISWSSSDSEESLNTSNSDTHIKWINADLLTNTSENDNEIVDTINTNSNPSQDEILQLSPIIGGCISPILCRKFRKKQRVKAPPDKLKFDDSLVELPKKMNISQFYSPPKKCQTSITGLCSQEAIEISSITNVGDKDSNLNEVNYFIPAKRKKRNKLGLASHLATISDLHQAKIAIWNHELLKGFTLTPEEENCLLKLKIIHCTTEFNRNILKCQLIESSDLFKEENFIKYALNWDRGNHLNTIDQTKCLIIVGHTIPNLKFNVDEEFRLYPPYNIKIVNCEGNICCFLNAYKLLPNK